MGERRAPPQVVIGTAGHVDHGKSSLVRALTGTDPDRLPEEKRRGMTLDLGFAFLPGAAEGAGVDLAFIDCPGHERFVRHLIAGAGSIDGGLLVISAAEGPCAQTREHLDILRLLGLRWGRVVLSKCDLVDADGLAAAAALAGDLVAGTVLAAEPPLAVSAQRGDGLAELAAWLFRRAADHRGGSGAHARLPIDRVFAVQGHGTVVTGTLLAGELALGDAIELYPGGLARVRSLQVNRRPVDRAFTGQRTAVNLAGIEREAIARGAWIATPGTLAATTVVDVGLEVLPIGVAHRQRVDVHHGTASVAARVHLLQTDAAGAGAHDAQLRLEEALHVQPGDRLVLRRPSPSATVAGAVVVDVAPPRHRRFSDAVRARFAAGRGSEGERLLGWLSARAGDPPTHTELVAWAGGPLPAEAMLAAAIGQVRARHLGAETWWWAETAWAAARAEVVERLRRAHSAEAERCWYTALELGVADRPAQRDLLAALVGDGVIAGWDGRFALDEAVPSLPAVLVEAARSLLASYRAAGLQPPYDHPALAAQPDPRRAARALTALRERGRLLRVDGLHHLDRAAGDELVVRVRAALAAGEAIDVQWMKRTWGLTRKHAVPLLEWLDAIAVTRRVGDERKAGPRSALPIPVLGGEP